MEITQFLTDGVVLAELGKRLARHRLDRNQTQAQLAEEAGVSKRTVERIEAGSSVQLTSFLRLCRALELIDGLAALVPEPPESPMRQLAKRKKIRRRVRAPTVDPPAPAASRDEWTWGREE